MINVTFSELRNNAKKFFDAVEHGETLEVYRHGKPVALVTPAREKGRDHWKQVSPMAVDGASLSRAVLADRSEDR